MNKSTSTAEWSTTTALRFRDFDYLGHMTATSYLELIEEARVQWLAKTDAAGFPSYVVAEQRLTFHCEILPTDGPVTITLSSEVRSNKKFEVTEKITSPSGRLHATSLAVLVAWDRERRQSRPLTDAELDHLKGQQVKEASGANHGHFQPVLPQQGLS